MDMNRYMCIYTHIHMYSSLYLHTYIYSLRNNKIYAHTFLHAYLYAFFYVYTISGSRCKNVGIRHFLALQKWMPKKLKWRSLFHSLSSILNFPSFFLCTKKPVLIYKKSVLGRLCHGGCTWLSFNWQPHMASGTAGSTVETIFLGWQRP